MFENIIGHDKQKDILKSSIEQDSVSHSYLFVGKEGIGKCLLAKEFAKNILGAGSLESCPDFKYITKMENKKDIVIDQIRKEILDDIYIAPISGNKKVYIIDDAGALNISSQNALLKTLEEPPEYVVIILVASTIDSFLTTIRSRLNIIKFNGLDERIILDYISKKFGKSLTKEIINYIDGSLGQAIYLMENNYSEKLKFVEDLYDSIQKNDYILSNKTLENIEFNDNVILDYFEHIIYMNRKYNLIKFVEKARTRLKNNGNYDIVIDSMILKIINEI